MKVIKCVVVGDRFFTIFCATIDNDNAFMILFVHYTRIYDMLNDFIEEAIPTDFILNIFFPNFILFSTVLWVKHVCWTIIHSIMLLYL